MASRALPDWPRVQRANLAWRYAGYGSERDFHAAVATGDMPLPFTIGGADGWDRADLDAAVDAIKAGASVGATNWRKEAERNATNRRVAGRRA